MYLTRVAGDLFAVWSSGVCMWLVWLGIYLQCGPVVYVSDSYGRGFICSVVQWCMYLTHMVGDLFVVWSSGVCMWLVWLGIYLQCGPVVYVCDSCGWGFICSVVQWCMYLTRVAGDLFAVWSSGVCMWLVWLGIYLQCGPVVYVSDSYGRGFICSVVQWCMYVTCVAGDLFAVWSSGVCMWLVWLGIYLQCGPVVYVTHVAGDLFAVWSSGVCMWLVWLGIYL